MQKRIVLLAAGLLALLGVDAIAATPLQQQWEVASRAAVKISVRAEGWYRVPAADLFAAGLDRNVDPRTLELWVDGNEVPITVEEPFAAIRFYGTGLDIPSTDRRVYWLTTGKGKGKRIKVDKGKPAEPSSTNFPATVGRRDKFLFVTSINNGDAESFFGPIVSMTPSEPTLQTLTIASRDASVATAQLEVSAQGAPDLEAPTEHRVAVTVNGNLAGEMRYIGAAVGTLSTAFPAAWLTEGTNAVGFAALNGWNDLSAVQSVRLTYAHTYAADGDRLAFTSSNGVRLTGFSTTNVRLLDVTEEPVELTPTAANGAILADLPKNGARRVLAVTGFASPARIESNAPSSLNAVRADFVIITHRPFIPAMERLAALHRAEGLSVLVAAVDDVYDEFSYGAADPAALRSFIAALRPRAVMLAGDATFDPRNYLGYGELDLVPTKLVWTTLLKTSSDGWFTNYSLPIGRLPVRTVAEADAAVTKILAYANAPAGMPWSRRALIVTDYDPNQTFQADIAPARAALPAGVTAVDIDAANGVAAARAQLFSEWNSGAALLDFFGHGTVDLWTSGMLGSGDVPQLANGSALPFVSAMTCLNGYFHDLYTYSLAEALLAAPNGGAIGVFTSSSLTFAAEQKDGNVALVRTLYAGGTFGEAALAAWNASPSSDFRASFQLFGDPMLRLPRR